MELKKVGILGTGHYVPDQVITNHDLEKIIDTSDAWITKRTGIKERRKIAENQACSDLASEAARKALEDAGLKPQDLDLIVVATVTGDYQLPATACLVQNNIGAVNAGAFDVNAACNGFVLALSTASKFIATGEVRNALVIGAETLTRFTNYEDRTSCILFGDGAGAMVIGEYAGQGEILSSQVKADGTGWMYMNIPAGGSRTAMTAKLLDENAQCIIVKGREVYKFAVSRMVELVNLARERHPDMEFGMVIPHQVNMRIIESAREKLGLREEDIAVDIEKFGNTSAASVPIMFDEVKASGALDAMKDRLLVLCAFGAGLNWGYCAIKW